MAKKQTIILTHGNTTPNADLIQLGEVLVQHAATKTETGLHTVTEIDGEKTVVTIPSKDWVASEIAKVDAGGINQTITELQTKVNGIESDYKGADEAINEELGDINGKITEIEGKIETIIGDDSSSSMRAVAKDEAEKAVASVVDGAPEAFDTLKEIANWITGGEEGAEGAAQIVSDVEKLKDIVDGYTDKTSIKNDIEGVKTTISELGNTYYTESEIDTKVETINSEIAKALKNITETSGNLTITFNNETQKYDITLSGLALNSDLSTLTGRVTTAEGEIATIKGDYVKTITTVDGQLSATGNNIDLSNMTIDGGTY